MNIIKIFGGLGNQMFQYAFGKGMEANVAYDTSWSDKPHDPPRPYGLNKFRLGGITMVNANSGLPIIHETDLYRYNSEYQKLSNHYFFGYWQHVKYIEPILSVLKDEFKVQSMFLTEKYFNYKEQIFSGESVALHVRRGDYLTKGHHLLPLEYYKNALSIIKDEERECKIFVFSDDLEWCKVNIPNAIYVDLPDYLSLDLMRYCTHIITANSTFSWWAGVLKVKSGLVFAPLRWRLNDAEEDVINQEKFIPDNWLRL